MENQKFICSNPSCGRTFVTPLKTQNLNLKGTGAYNACPYCLTEILTEEKTCKEIESEPTHEKKELKVKESSITPIEENGSQTPKVQGCVHHFGYLSKRSSKDKIPEECMMCENIVQCMLKNMTG